MDALILKTSGKNGKGVFTNRDLKKGDKIIDFKGKYFTFKQLPSPYDKVEDHYVQIGKNLLLGPSNSLDDYINHSCSPNSGLIIKNKKARLISIKNIKKGKEITWDYSTSMNEDDFTMKCNCKSKNCRKIIKDFKYLPKKVKEKYIELGIIPKYNIKYL